MSVQDRGGNVNENRYVGDLIASLVSSETNTTLQQRVLALPAVLKGTVLASAQRGVALWSDLRVDSVGQFRLCFQPLYGAMQLSLSNLFEVQTGPPVMLAVLLPPCIALSAVRRHPAAGSLHAMPYSSERRCKPYHRRCRHCFMRRPGQLHFEISAKASGDALSMASGLVEGGT